MSFSRRLRCTSATVLTGLVVGLGAPSAQAAEPTSVPSAASAVQAGRALAATSVTTADVADLVRRVDAAGGDSRELRSIQTALTAKALTSRTPSLAQGFKQKIVIAALRHGGALLQKIVGRLSPRAGEFLLRNASKLADFLDALENWAEYPIITFLMHNGVPFAEAKAIADVVLFFVG